MAIEPIGGPGGAERSGKAPGRESQPAAVDSKRREAADRLELSESARQIKSLVDRVRELPEIRESRIEELKHALADGTYRVDPKRVAESLVEFEDGLVR